MAVQIAGARYTHQHAGVTWYFCSPHCLERFQKDPEQYAIQPGKQATAKRQIPRSVGRELLWVIAIFGGALLTVLIVRGFARPVQSATSVETIVGVPAGQHQAVDTGYGGVIVTAAHERRTASDTTDFALSLDSHMTNLSAFQPLDQVRLRLGGSLVTPWSVAVTGERSTHHQNYQLTFPKTQGEVWVVVQNVGGVAERQLPFQL